MNFKKFTLLGNHLDVCYMVSQPLLYLAYQSWDCIFCSSSSAHHLCEGQP